MNLTNLKSQIKNIIREELDEMARTAGTGNSVEITEEGKNLLKSLSKGGQTPQGIRKSHVEILAWLLKSEKEGKRVQKIDYATEIGKPQPAVNGLFNELIQQNLVKSGSYTSIAKTATPKPAVDYTSMLADLDLEDKPTKSSKKSK